MHIFWMMNRQGVLRFASMLRHFANEGNIRRTTSQECMRVTDNCLVTTPPSHSVTQLLGWVTE